MSDVAQMPLPATGVIAGAGAWLHRARSLGEGRRSLGARVRVAKRAARAEADSGESPRLCTKFGCLLDIEKQLPISLPLT
jgi:hypothetical protein